MSTSIERFFGYRMICTKEAKCENETTGINYKKFDKYKFLHDKEEHLKNHPEDKTKFKDLETLGFRWIEDINIFNETNYFTLIVDGMNGKYVWLIYVEKFKWDEYCLEDEDDNLNEKLKSCPVPKILMKK